MMTLVPANLNDSGLFIVTDYKEHLMVSIGCNCLLRWHFRKTNGSCEQNTPSQPSIFETKTCQSSFIR
mgnify:CR=1 FL=1